MEAPAPEWRIDEGYRVELFSEQDEVAPGAIVDLWEREDVVRGEEARRRIQEVHLIALHDEDGLVGVSSAYLRRNAQLDMDLWYYRAFVARAHRMSNVAVTLAMTGRDLLERRFLAGDDPRAQGAVYEVENEGLKRHFPHALWLPTGFTFIGENARGDHVRVRYFPGAKAPEPPR